MSEFPCYISNRTCKPLYSDNLVFIIGSANPEFEGEIKAIKDILEGFGLNGDFAVLNSQEKGFDVFCNKICSKILASKFCVVMLNDPIALPYLDNSKEKGIFRAPRANVYYELGIAVALRKRVIPIMRKGLELPFDVQHLDVDFYKDLDDLRNKLKASVRAILEKPASVQIIKQPDLELSLLDAENKPVKTLLVSPIFEKITKVKTNSFFYKPSTGLWFAANLCGVSKKPTADLVPLRICLANNGDILSKGIRVFLHFPNDCVLFSKLEFTNALESAFIGAQTGSGGITLAKDKSEARAWVEELGNDLVVDDFDEVYVKFPKEDEYSIKATVTQHNYPPKHFVFKIIVKPKLIEKTEYIYEEPKPEDKNPEVLEGRIKELGKEEGEKPK